MHGGGGLRLDALVIETTGMADPSPVAQTFFADEVVQESYRLDGIVTVVDAKHLEQHLDEKKADGAINETVQQLGFADRIILNKVDLVPEAADLERIESRIRAINAFAPLVKCTNGQVPVDTVLELRAFDLRRVLVDDPAFLEDHKSAAHDKAVSSFALSVPDSVELQPLRKWISNLLNEEGENLYRMKGILSRGLPREVRLATPCTCSSTARSPGPRARSAAASSCSRQEPRQGRARGEFPRVPRQ